MASAVILLRICLLVLIWQQRDKIKINLGGQNRVNRQFRPQQTQLEGKLLKLLGGKHQIAHRLIQQSQLRYPDKSADWHWEKAIYDLERDRWR